MSLAKGIFLGAVRDYGVTCLGLHIGRLHLGIIAPGKGLFIGAWWW